MDESRRRVVTVLEKEIKTYVALSLFRAKNGIKEHVRAGGEKSSYYSPSFYKERMKVQVHDTNCKSAGVGPNRMRICA